MNNVFRLTAFAAALGASASVLAAAAVGQPAPAFSAVDTSGKTVSLADFKGRAVVLEWVNPGCPYVKKHYDSANMQATQKNAVAQGAVWLAINSTHTGASDYMAPAALAGTLVQTTAETLAGLILVNLAVPGHPVIFGNWPFVSDLRTGAFTGGSGEDAVLAAAASQIARYYDLPCGVGAGMADAKLPDNQAGHEKGVTTTLAGVAGANLIYESAGMLASLMACSFEAFVIDNDMLGNVLRAVRGIEVNDETLSLDVIREAVEGPGHYLGQAQTLSLMKTEYVYPRLSDRSRIEEWQAAGGPDIRERARERVREILGDHYPVYIDPVVDAEVRRRFPILIPPEAMRPGNDRW